MCKYVFVTGDKCVYKWDDTTGRPRFITKSEGFFDHGFWTKQPTPDCQAERGGPRCDIGTKMPKYKRVAIFNGPHVQFDRTPYFWRNPNGDLIPDYRCKRCRDRENLRAA